MSNPITNLGHLANTLQRSPSIAPGIHESLVLGMLEKALEK